MPDTTANEVITQKHKRFFIQYGGPRPNNPVKYSGRDGQYMTIDSASAPESGGVDPIWVPDPRRTGKYRIVGRSITPADLPTATLKLLEKRGAVPRQLTTINCPFNIYEVSSSCKDVSDFISGWTDYVLIYSYAIVDDKDLGTRGAWDSDDVIEDSLSLTLAEIYPVGALSFGEGASEQVSREVVDTVYGSNIQCGDCGPADDGTRRIYDITKSSGSGSPGLPAELVYTVDGGANWNQANISGMGANESPLAVDVAGSKLIVIGDNAYYWAQINSKTGVPGTFTKVTTGFVAGHAPTDLYVAGPQEVYFSAAGGYIYKSTNVTAGVSVINAANTTSNDLLRIHGNGETILATGKGSTVIISLNRGITFAFATTAPSGIALDVTAVNVRDQDRYWVGTSNSGRVFYTLDGGETWNEQTFTYSGIGNVRDIVFANDDVGYVAHDVAVLGSVAFLYATIDGGSNWTDQENRILNWPTFSRVNRIATPRDVDSATMANNVALAGLAGDGTDGIIYLGTTTFI